VSTEVESYSIPATEALVATRWDICAGWLKLGQMPQAAPNPPVCVYDSSVDPQMLVPYKWD
jgi:hypothetical protein